MATKTFQDIADRLINSLKSLQKGEWFDVASKYQDVPLMRLAMSSMAKEKSGHRLSFRLNTGSLNDDGHHGLYEDYDVDRPDVMTEGFVDWVNQRKGFSFDTREADPMGDPEALVDDMEVLRNDMWNHVCEDIEEKAWQVKSVNDTLLPNGVPYYVVWDSTDAGGLTDALPAGHSTVATINPAVQTQYQNYTDTYVNATADDLGVRTSRAIRQTGWRPPPKTKGDNEKRHAIYCGQTALEGFENMARLQNDSLGFDAQPTFMRSMIARVSPTWVPYLDSAAASGSNPVYIINHNYFYPCFKKGWKFKEYPAQKLEKQPTAIQVMEFTTYNWSCPSRRHQAVVAVSAPFGES